MNKQHRKEIILFYGYTIVGLVCYAFYTYVLYIVYLNLFHSLYPETLIPYLIIPTSLLLLISGVFFFSFFRGNSKLLRFHVYTHFVIPILWFVPWPNSETIFTIWCAFMLSGIAVYILSIRLTKQLFKTKFEKKK